MFLSVFPSSRQFISHPTKKRHQLMQLAFISAVKLLCTRDSIESSVGNTGKTIRRKGNVPVRLTGNLFLIPQKSGTN
jgi:hypothetical protein